MPNGRRARRLTRRRSRRTRWPGRGGRVVGSSSRRAQRSVWGGAIRFNKAPANCGDGPVGTAFWYYDLVDGSPGQESVVPCLVTAGALTRFDVGEWTLRAELCDPAMFAEKLLMLDFADGWTVLDDLGVAVMPAVGLYARAERKGWQWTADEVTEGLVAHESDLVALGTGSWPACVLGHDVGPRATRPQVVASGSVEVMDGALRWSGPVPEGCAGSPVFTGLPQGAAGYMKLVCLGVILPGGADSHEVVGFDKIRSAVRSLSSRLLSS